jgi:ABC-type multidrug transport system fused ATPase/permease subunit
MKNIWRVIGLLKELHGRIILVVIVTTVVGLGTLAVPYAFKLIVDEVTKAVSSNNSVAVERILQLLLLVGVIQLVILVFEYIGEYLQDNLRLDLFFGLRKRMMHHAIKLPLDYYETHPTGTVTDKVTSGVYEFGLWVDQLAQSALLQIIAIILALTVITVVSPLAGIIAIVTVLTKIAITTAKLRHVGQWRREGRRRYWIAQGLMVETIANIATVRSVSSENTIYSRFVKTYEWIREIRHKQIVLERRYNAINKLIDSIGLVLVLGVVSSGAIKGEYTVGDILLMSIYFTNIVRALEPLARFFDQTAEVEVAASGIVELLDVKLTVVDSPDAVALRDLKSIQFKNVEFHYPNHASKVLDKISFEINGNKTIALVGPSGTGKTTITKLLMRYYEPTGGQILINGKDISAYTADSLRRHFGVVMQDVALFNADLEENLKLARPDATRAELDEAVAGAHLKEFIDELPDGYATQVGERGIKLSGGQKQRVAIARAMLRNPQLIILDEATSALDSQSEQEVQKGLTKLMQGRMAVIIAHRLSTVRHADEIIVIKRGKIVERGSHTALVDQDGLYAKLYSMQGKL